MRYSNQIQVDHIGNEGQKKISDSHILVVGLGGLGSIALQYLVGAGFGTISICDHDTLELKNLHRQTIYREDQVGTSKALAAYQSMQGLNQDITIQPYAFAITEDLIPENVTQIVDCTDNKETKLWLDSVCNKRKIPLVSAGVGVFNAQIYNVMPGQTTRLPDVIGKAVNPTSHIVVGPVCGIVGSTQALIAIANAVGILLPYNMLNINALSFDIQRLTI